jgi:fructose transport system ATP-binding protein
MTDNREAPGHDGRPGAAGFKRENRTRTARDTEATMTTPTLSARGLVKRYGQVTAIDGADFDLYPGEVLAVVGDNGAGKSSMIKALSGALVPDAGEIQVDGKTVHFRTPIDARRYGIETVYQDLALSPAQDIAANMFLGREIRRTGPLGLVRKLDTAKMRSEAQRVLDELDIKIKSITQPVETLSGGQRQGVAVARAAAFGTKAVIMDEPTAALGVAESAQVLALIKRIRQRGLPVVLISHNMPHVFEIADRIHVHRLGRRVAVVSPKTTSMNQVVGLITGALELDEKGEVREVEAAIHTGLSA